MSGPLRILMTADTIGGVWTYCLELAAALAEENVELLLATMGDLPTAAQREEVAHLPHVRLRSSAFRLEWMEEPWADVEAAGEWLLEQAEEFQPNVVHLNGYVHADLPWHRPVLVAAHSCVFSWWSAVKGEEAPPRLAEYGRLVGAGLRKADLVVAPTHAVLAMLREHYHFATPARVIPNGREAKRFVPGSKRPLIFSAGRIWDQAKNLALLDRIVPDLAWPVQIAGRAGEAPSPRGSAVFLGELSPAEMAAHLAGASIYAAPARYEPFGLAILEAALSGCALVLSDLASLRENWSGAAVFVPPDDERAWVAALNELASDSPRRIQLAALAQERARRFTPAKTAAACLSAWRELSDSSAALRQEACCS